MKGQKGITLIALVITIIVLLILAGVSISMVVGQNGILSNAQNSVIPDAKAKEEEAVERSALAAISISSSKGNIALENGYFNQELKNEFGEGNYLLEETTDKFTVTIVGTGNSYEVDKFGNVSGQVPPGGNGGGENTETIVGMYEDLAGDEEGATEGKIHIGDYINYNPNPDSLTTAEMTEENGYKYVSANSETGLADAINDGYFTTEVTEQVFTAQSGLRWRVIGIEGSNLLITTEAPILPDSPVTMDDYTGYGMYGAYAYENGIREINNIARIYANGEGAVKESTRGMTITDVNNITGVVANGTTITPEGVDLYDNNYRYTINRV